MAKKLTDRQGEVLEKLAANKNVRVRHFVSGDYWELSTQANGFIRWIHPKTGRSLIIRNFIKYEIRLDGLTITPAGRQALNEQS